MNPTGLSTAATPLVLVFLATAALAVRTRDGGDVFCCGVQANCKNLTTLNIPIKKLAAGSPYYEPILSTDDSAVGYRSVCVTYFPVRNNAFIEFRAIKLKDGSMKIGVHLVSYLKPGVFRVQGLSNGRLGNSTTVHNSYVIDVTCKSCQPTYMYYKCFLYETCDFIDDAYDVVNGISSSVDSAPSCLDAFESLAAGKGLNVRGFTRTPGDSYGCVVRYGGSRCVNYERVAPNDRISYPPPAADY